MRPDGSPPGRPGPGSPPAGEHLIGLIAHGRKPGAVRAAGPRLPAVDEALAELAAYFRRRAVVPGSGAGPADRGGGRRPVGCHRRRLRRPGLSRHRRGGQPGPLGRFRDRGGAAVRFRPVLPAHADRQPQPVSCAALGLHRVRQQVTDRAPAGRPVHAGHGHAPGCARLAAEGGGAPHAAGAADPAFGGSGRGRAAALAGGADRR